MGSGLTPEQRQKVEEMTSQHQRGRGLLTDAWDREDFLLSLVEELDRQLQEVAATLPQIIRASVRVAIEERDRLWSRCILDEGADAVQRITTRFCAARTPPSTEQEKEG